MATIRPASRVNAGLSSTSDVSTVKRNGSGAPLSGAASAIGNGQIARPGSGVLLAGSSAIAATTDVARRGSGVVTSQDATASGASAGSPQSWAARSTAPGVVQAVGFATEAELDAVRFLDPQNDHITYDQTNVDSPGGCARFDILKTDGQDAGNLRIYLRSDQGLFGEGDEFYVQFRQYIPAYYATHAFSNGAGGLSDGFKQCIISQYSNSSVAGEIVLQNLFHRGFVQAYHRAPGGSDTALIESFSNVPCGATPDFKHQNAIDGDPGNPNPSTCLGMRQKHAGIQSYHDNGTGVRGVPDPEGPAFIFYPDDWLTVQVRIRIGNWDVANSLIQIKCGRDGDSALTLTHDYPDLALDQPPAGGFEAIWLTPFNTNRAADPTREDTFTRYDSLIVSTNEPGVPAAAIGEPTELATLLASMAANSWAPLTTNGLTPSLIEPGDSQVDTFYSQAKWDPIQKKVVAICQAHGTTYDSRELEYSEADNTWRDGPVPPVPSGQADQSHGYYMNAIDPVLGDRYWHRYASHTQYRKPQGGSWLTIAADLLDSTSFSVGFEFNPFMGSQGSLIAVGVYGISQWDKASDLSTKLEGLNSAYGDGDTGSCYDPDSQSIYWSGGGGVGTAFWQIDAAGTVTQKADVPSFVGVSSAGIRVSLLLDGTPGHGPVHIDFNTGVVSEYDVGADSWTQVSTLPAAILSGIDNDNLYWGCSIPGEEEDDDDCVMLVYGTGASRSVHIWKL